MQQEAEPLATDFVIEFEAILPKLVDILKLLQDTEVEEREINKLVI